MISSQEIRTVVNSLPFVQISNEIIEDATGKVEFDIYIKATENVPYIQWHVIISPLYPFKLSGHASIEFINLNLIQYPHIMEHGNLCLHTPDYFDVSQQLTNDLYQLKDWIIEYYIEEKTDSHYEHLVVNSVHDQIFLFTDFDKSPLKGDYGLARLSSPMLGQREDNDKIHETNVYTRIIKAISSSKNWPKEWNFCKLSSVYRSPSSSDEMGLYCILDNIPCRHNKFIVKDFKEIGDFLSQEQRKFIIESSKKSFKDSNIPILIGYNINAEEIHWQVFLYDPNINLSMGKKFAKAGFPTVWISEFLSSPIAWAQTENMKYSYFFGRGALPISIAKMKILMIGIGAIGSMVATTLVRMGAMKITLSDYDKVVPGNICRSEYKFFGGFGDKTSSLSKNLISISPFVDVDQLPADLLNGAISLAATKSQESNSLKKILDRYDLIIDCTTDNYLMYGLEQLKLSATIINLSISNKASELVCAFSPNICKVIDLVYTRILNSDPTDLYYPTGCWNYTFKASYNDIATKVQYALSNIIKMLSKQIPMSNFYISEIDNCLEFKPI